jgi:transposase
MIKRLLFRASKQEPHVYSSNSLSPWQTSAKARERMNVLREALANGQARGDVVRMHAKLWGLSTEWVDELITRVLSEEQHAIHEQAQRELAIYIAHIRAQLARYASNKDHPSTTGAYERLALLTKA